MSALPRQPAVSRRQFLRATVRGSGVVGLALSSASLTRAARPGRESPNPFAYDLSRFQRTDPKLLAYEEVARLQVARAEPRRLAIGPDDRLYLAAGSYVAALDGEGAPLVEFALSAAARCVAVAPDGLVYVGLRDHVEVFSPQGRRLARWDSPGQRAWFTGLAVAENDLFAADAGNRVLLRYDRTGKLRGRIGEKEPARPVPGFIVPSPFFDVKVHRDGLLRVTNPGRHRVEAYTPAGDFEFAWGKASAAIDGFCGCCNPISLAVLPDGRLVTAEKGLPRVKVYDAQGALESVVAGVESFPESLRLGAGGEADSLRGGLDVAVDSRGGVHILETATATVRIMKPKPAARAPETRRHAAPG